jgi:hypothetical protein
MIVKKLIVVDYQEGAGGEFIANWLSAHFGQKIEYDLQSNPNYLQKWLNAHSLIYPDWADNFSNYLGIFDRECLSRSIDKISVPYHLYKWPGHVEILQNTYQARFVKINCQGYESQVFHQFRNKVLDRILGKKDFSEVKFILQGQSREKIDHCISLFRDNQLTYKDLLSYTPTAELKSLPSDDIEIMYEDFFINFERTPVSYKKLCDQLDLKPDANLLELLIDRNKKIFLNINGYLNKV